MASVERAVCGVSRPNMRILSGSQPSEALFSNVFDAVVLWLSGVMSGWQIAAVVRHIEVSWDLRPERWATPAECVRLSEFVRSIKIQTAISASFLQRILYTSNEKFFPSWSRASPTSRLPPTWAPPGPNHAKMGEIAGRTGQNGRQTRKLAGISRVRACDFLIRRGVPGLRAPAAATCVISNVPMPGMAGIELQRRISVHIHPAVSELIPTMLGQLQPLSNTAGAPQ